MNDGLAGVFGAPKVLLRAEGLLHLVVALWLYQQAHLSWPIFAALFLLPDVSMLGYLLNKRIGALLYNVAHTELIYIPIAIAGWLEISPLATAVGLIGLAHVGFDRAVGYGLKYPSSFGDTHLGKVGKHTA